MTRLAFTGETLHCSEDGKMLQINMRISLRILTCEIDFNEDPTLRRAGFFFFCFSLLHFALFSVFLYRRGKRRNKMNERCLRRNL